ncbi:MAG: peptidylprolyl isomerase [Clostridia bacterium]|nr:peptidylprolyl isomerase [Clostridia bacterium]
MKKDLGSKIILIIAIVLVVALILGLGIQVVRNFTQKRENPVATIEVENMGTIKVELYPDMAPNTVTNFIALANNNFYDGLTFHRVIKDFMIQGGDKKGDGTGTPTLGDIEKELTKEQKEAGKTLESEYTIKGEMIANGYEKNNLKLQRGILAMARSDYSSISSSLTEQGYNSAGSQFFIMHADKPELDGSYTGFGKVIEGMDVVDKIAELEVTYKSSELAEGAEKPKDANGNELTADMPINKPVIKSIKVDTKGVNYGMPDTLEPFNYYNYLMQYYNSMYGNN